MATDRICQMCPKCARLSPYDSYNCPSCGYAFRNFAKNTNPRNSMSEKMFLGNFIKSKKENTMKLNRMPTEQEKIVSILKLHNEVKEVIEGKSFGCILNVLANTLYDVIRNYSSTFEKETQEETMKEMEEHFLELFNTIKQYHDANKHQE